MVYGSTGQRANGPTGPTLYHVSILKRFATQLLGLRWGFEVNDQPLNGWLEFLRPSGERQKHGCAINGALSNGCAAPVLFGKKPLLGISQP